MSTTEPEGDNPLIPDDPAQKPGDRGTHAASSARKEETGDRSPAPKQVIVMRTDLKMRKGKMIAQGAHASMKVILDRGSMSPHDPTEMPVFTANVTYTMRDWIEGLFTKVCLRVESEAELDAIYEKALEAGLPCALIVDAGKTEFKGVPTKTCCAIGPAYPKDIDLVTGDLKLL